MDKPEIIFDEATHTYLVDGEEVPSVTTILQPLSNRAYSAVNPSVLEYARNRGTAVHEALEIYDLGGELEVVPETEGFIRAYLEWSQIYRPKWIGVEQIVYNAEDGYIGTLDRFGVLNGSERAVIDIKTSNPTKEALVAVCLQTYAYTLALSETDEGSCPKRYALFLKADGNFRFQNCEEYEEAYMFRSSDLFISLLNNHKAITRVLESKKNGKHKK